MAVVETTQTKTGRKALSLPFDMPLLLTVGALLLFGLMMVYSTTFDWAYVDYGNPAALFLRQLQWVALGLFLMFIVARLPYRLWQRLAVPLMLATIAALVLVLVLGASRFNAQRSFFGGSVQPSELAKFATIVYLAVWLSSKGDKIRALGYGLIPFGIIVGILAGLILLQPDLSAAVTIVVIATLMFFIAGADMLQMGLVAVLGSGTVWVLFQLPISIAVTGRQRLADYLIGLQDLTQASWHVQMAASAFVNGGLFGRGLGAGHQKFGFLPTSHTDSIFAVIGEELGLFGCLMVIALFALLAWRGFRIAARSRDPLGALLAAGIICWVVFEALVNAAVMVGALPFAGNALPFISYGGSNLVMVLIAMGVLLSISRRTEAEPLPRKSRFTGTLNAERGTQVHATFDFSRRDGRRRLSRLSRR
ncbi:MAG: putative peptidoglycan glycosyltransferase FtsW [Anaerolineales bacterium]|nr:putative peptidoglycan glycosyltransferase FtsW [Anaerolineales bacterium]